MNTVDPVDGTTNLAAGIPFVTTSIALARNGIVELGCVYDPSRDEMFVARRGYGASLNGTPFSSAKVKLGLRDSILCVGSPPDPKAFARNLNVIAQLGPKVRGLRMFSSAALIFCWTAVGRVTAYIATDINAWDFAAGRLIVEEAGGETSCQSGAPLELVDRDTVCSIGGVHSEIICTLQSL